MRQTVVGVSCRHRRRRCHQKRSPLRSARGGSGVVQRYTLLSSCKDCSGVMLLAPMPPRTSRLVPWTIPRDGWLCALLLLSCGRWGVSGLASVRREGGEGFRLLRLIGMYISWFKGHTASFVLFGRGWALMSSPPVSHDFPRRFFDGTTACPSLCGGNCRLLLALNVGVGGSRRGGKVRAAGPLLLGGSESIVLPTFAPFIDGFGLTIRRRHRHD